MERINLDNRSLRKFGVVMGVELWVITTIIFLRHRHCSQLIPVIGAAFFLLGLFVPQGLRQIYLIWMKLAHVLGWINSRIILCIMFYFVITPIGLSLRIFRVDLLDQEIEKHRLSYLRKIESKEFRPSDCERQF